MKKMVLTTASVFALTIAGSGVGLAAGMSNTTANTPATRAAPNATAQGAQVSGSNWQANRATISESQKEEVQQELKRAGLYRGDVDGIFGPETRRAIAEFQRQHGLSQTGTLDQQTLTALNHMNNASGSNTTSGGSSTPAGPKSNAPLTPSR